MGITAVRDALFSFQGRLRRREIWPWSLGLIVIGNLTALGVHAAMWGEPGYAAGADLDDPGVYQVLYVLPALAGAVVIGWSFAALVFRRSHDRGRSGWPYAILLLISFASAFLAMPDPAQDQTARTAWGALTVGINLATIWMVVDLWLLEGTPGENRFGPSPKGVTSRLGRRRSTKGGA